MGRRRKPRKAGDGLLRRSLRFLIRWTGLLCVPGGVLWALSPLGVYLSEYRFDTPNVFWKMFLVAPLLLLVGLVGLRARQSGRSGRMGKVGSLVALLGLALILLGDVGLYWLKIDDTYIMTAPAYHVLRSGLVVLAAGAILFGLGAPRDGALPTWGLLPFVVGSLCGLISFTSDLGSFGSALWILFGLGWAWLGFSLAAEGLLSSVREGRKSRAGTATKG